MGDLGSFALNGFLHLFPLSTIGLPERIQLVAKILQGLFFLSQTTLGEFHLPLRLLPLSLRSAARNFRNTAKVTLLT